MGPNAYWALLDTGADTSVVSAQTWEEIRPFFRNRPEVPYGRDLRSASAARLATRGTVRIDFSMAEQTWQHDFVICEDISRDFIIGLDFLTAKDATFRLRSGQISFQGEPYTTLYPMPPTHVGDSPLQAVAASAPTGDTITNVERAVGNLLLEDLQPSQVEQAAALLRECADVFAEEGKPLGRTALVSHHIDTGTNPPVRIRGRRIPPHQRQAVDEVLDDMLRHDIIRPSVSSWSSPLLLVKKKDGSMRCCVDYRQLNERTIKDAYPLPRVDESIDALAGAKYFSVLDLKSGFWQCQLDEASKEKTAFPTHRGLFEYNVLPMGLCNSPAVFSRLMNDVLAGLTWNACLVYLDDTIVIGRHFQEHLENLRLVLDRFRRANLQINPKKCHFLKKQVRYLGHVVTPGGVHTDPETVAKVRDWPRPANQKEVRSFLGLANYYRKYIDGYAQIAGPLHRLTGKNVRFEWSQGCEDAFQSLRGALCRAPVLALPDFSPEAGSFVLDTDASEDAVGAVLSQEFPGEGEKVIAYGSKCLTKPERNYCVTRKEMLAIVHFLKEFRPYLIGKPFKVRTDHTALTWLTSFKEPTGQVARWLQKIQEYQFTTEYRPGPKHTNADTLSRRPQRNHGDCPTCVVTREADETLSSITWDYGWTREDLREAQRMHPASAHVLAWLRQGRHQPPDMNHAAAIPELPQYRKHWECFEERDGILCFRNREDTPWRVALPPSWRDQALRQCHNLPLGGHTGKESTYQKLNLRFWWPRMRRDTNRWVNCCGVCGQLRGPNPHIIAPLQPLEIGEPFGRLSVDIVGPLPRTREGNRYILTMIDAFTKWAEAVPLKEHTATTCATAILQTWAARYGAPKELLTDQGREFESALFRSMCQTMGIKCYGRHRTTLRATERSKDSTAP